jgi:hypothetical protein
MVGLPCIAAFMPIFGLDFHKELPPLPPVPIPHVVVWFIYGIGAESTSRIEMSVRTPIGAIACRGHDAGPLVGHIPIPPISCAFLPVVLAGSGSKCEFGAGSVKIGSSGYPVAVGLFFAIGPQLHCNDLPIPGLNPTCPGFTGFNLSILNLTVKAGFSLADLIASMAASLYDIAVTAGLAFLGGKIGDAIGNIVGGLILKCIPVGFIQLAFAIIAPDVLSAYIGQLANFAIGGPLGWAPDAALYANVTTEPTPENHVWGGHYLPNGDDTYDAARGATERAQKTSAQVYNELFGP